MEIQNPVSHYTQTAVSDDQGKFELDNIPYNSYHLTVTVAGFQNGDPGRGRASAVPMALAEDQLENRHTQSATVTVEAGQDLIETDPTTHTDIDRGVVR